MPKRTAAHTTAQQAAGAAAVPTASTQPRPKHPDAAAESEYCRLLSEFTVELNRAGIESCRLQDVLKSMNAIWVESVLNRGTVAEDTDKCLRLLATMLGQPDDPNEVENWHTIGDVKHVWHPRKIHLMCKMLLSENKASWKDFARSYLLAVGTVKARADLLQAVMRDGSCMGAIWELLQLPASPHNHWQHAAILMKTLVSNACIDSKSLVQMVPDHLASVLELHLRENHIQQQLQQQASRQGSPDTAGLSQAQLCIAFSGVHLMGVIDILGALRPALQFLAEWPDRLLHAHLCALLKVIARDDQGISTLVRLGLRQVSPCAHDLRFYAHPTMLPKAARILSSSPPSCTLLPQITAHIFTADFSSWEDQSQRQAMAGHTMFFQFLSAILSHDESRAFQHQLPFEQLSKSLGVVMIRLSESAFDDMDMLQNFGFSRLLKAAAKLLLCLSKAEYCRSPPSTYLLHALEKLVEEPNYSSAVVANLCLRDPEMVKVNRPYNVVLCDKAAAGRGEEGIVAYLECESGMMMIMERARPSSAAAAFAASASNTRPLSGGRGKDSSQAHNSSSRPSVHSVAPAGLQGSLLGGGPAQEGMSGSQDHSTSSSSGGKSTSRISAAGPHHSSTGGGAATSTVPIRTCMACGKTGTGLKVCGRCMSVSFCDATCQRNVWPLHRQDCVPREAPNPP